MNWDRIEGEWKAAKGALKATWGKLTDNDIDIINGDRGAAGGQAARSLRASTRTRFAKRSTSGRGGGVGSQIDPD